MPRFQDMPDSEIRAASFKLSDAQEMVARQHGFSSWQAGEIGIRMALGAQRGAMVWMVLRRVLLLAALGLAISVPAALSASQLVKSFLLETQPNDPGTLALAGVVLLSAAILAGYAPARRASRIDPLAALRHE